MSERNKQVQTMENKYYLFNPEMVKNSECVELKQGTVEKSVTEARWVDQYNWTPESGVPDWEHRVSIMYPNLEYDENTGKYRIWYHALKFPSPVNEYPWHLHLIDKENTNHVDLNGFCNTAKGTLYDGYDLLCYMESEDGIHWIRPELDEFLYQTRTGEIIRTNIVRVGLHGQAVRRNENPNPSEPAYLLAGRTWETDSLDAKGAPIGVAISWSEDGIHWEEPVTIKTGYDCSDTIRAVRADTHNQLFWSEELGRYVVITRGYSKSDPSVRLVVSMESVQELHSIRDLLSIKKQEKDKYWEKTSKYWTSPEIVLDDQVTLDAQPYTMPVAHLAKGCYLGVACMANFDKDTDGVWNSVHAQLTWSSDARTWHYMDQGKPFIANAPIFELKPGNDYGMIYSSAPIQVDGMARFFYSATPELHYVTYDEIPKDIKEIVAREIPKADAAKMFTRTSTLSVATIKKDRFAGLWSEDGAIITRTFVVCGGSLKLTADVKPGGWIKMEILDTGDAAVKEYELSNFCTIETDVTDEPVYWGVRDLSELTGKTISLRILMKNAGVYTIGGDIAANAEAQAGG